MLTEKLVSLSITSTARLFLETIGYDIPLSNARDNAFTYDHTSDESYVKRDMDI